jgi:hypothetical protein
MAGAAARNVTQKSEVTAMIDTRKTDRTYASPPPSERWRKFLERIGTRSNDFGTRLSRARFVYLHRRETGTHWLPL